ncbi:MAG TPA: CocE/NonD family hydrolase, partial [Stellaceae bacterium]|nr:CocE/NonD family hydrolase [Stellaceae bacterium]
MAQNEGERPKVELIHPAELVKAPPVPVPGIKVEANVYVTMRDGVKLAVDVYLPEQNGKYPALLSLSPYNKDIQRKPPHWSHAIE